jgi:hypothetical protein
MPIIDPLQEKDTYQRGRIKVLRLDKGTSTSVSRQVEYHVALEKPNGKVSMQT